MSVVTTVILIADDPDGEIVERVNAFTGNSQGSALGLKKIDHDMSGGYKVPEVDTYFGAYNHFDVDGFEVFLEALRWPDPDLVVVIIHTGIGSEDLRVWRPNRVRA